MRIRPRNAWIPTRLGMKLSAPRRLLRSKVSANTRRTYRTALVYWGAWYAPRYGRVLTAPVSVPTGIQFILDDLDHNPFEEPVGPSPFVPSSRTTQQLLLPAIDRVLVACAYKVKPGPWALVARNGCSTLGRPVTST
jgi:hypothetical protein